MIDIKQLFKGIIGREPETTEVRSINEMLNRTSPEFREDIGLVTDLVIRSHHIYEMHRCVDRLTIGMREYALSQGEGYAIAVADKVWKRIMENLPWRTQGDSIGWVRGITIILALWFAMGCTAGYATFALAHKHHRESTQAATEEEFARCVDAAVGRSWAGSGKPLKGASPRPDSFVEAARTCAAEYADRRADGL